MTGQGHAQSRYTGPVGRLTELTDIMTRFRDESLRHPLGSKRRAQLERDRASVGSQQWEEVRRLLRAGHSREALSAHLDRVDPYRDGIPASRDPAARRVRANSGAAQRQKPTSRKGKAR